jgi:hypothetical protein
MNYNTAKNRVLHKLYEDGVLNGEQFEHYRTEYRIVAVKCGWFKRFASDKNNW